MGHALEFVQADVIARYQKLLGSDLFFNTGTDEHGQKIYEKALEEGKEPQEYCDEYAEKFKVVLSKLNILSEIHFVRTTDAHHIDAAQEFWKRCEEKGDIYKKAYKIKYCVGCELEKTDSELEEGKCPLHPNLTLKEMNEENYFFRFSKYQKPLLDFYAANPDFVIPRFRFHEIINFVEQGLVDFSISRLKEKMPWGIAVPGDDAQVMYVWFDALINYISTLGWPENEVNFNGYWGSEKERLAVQIAGKDNLRQQSAMWQAMLLSASLPLSRQVIIHGFITSGGQKMSKSAGNVIDPYAVIEQYSTDALRYWLTREMNTFEDGDFTWEKFKESYNGGLANGLGNLVSRVVKMAANSGVSFDIANRGGMSCLENETAILKKYHDALEEYNIKEAANVIWEAIAETDRIIQKTEPFKKIKTDPEAAKKDISLLLRQLDQIALMLSPLLPATSDLITHIIQNPNSNFKPLFPRIQ
jgi:methionyl-tRNA synthetase